jgi:fructose-bisphosphate aldolase class II
MPFCDGVRLHEAYRRAQAERFAFMANNVAEPNVLIGLLEAYAEARSDLLVQISPGAAKFAGGGDKRAGLRGLAALIRELAEPYPICVFINLDHFTSGEMDLIEEAIGDRLVSSIMIDASRETFEENVRISRAVTEMAEGSGILVEAELGKIKGVEDEVSSDESLYTDPDEAAEFVKRTGADLLAISVGTQHGVSKGRDLELRVDLAARIRDRLAESGLDAPLVLHGTSGLLPEQVREMVGYGICKLNKDTHYQYVYGRTAAEFFAAHAEGILPPEGVEDDVVNLFAKGDWSPDKKVFDPRAVGREIQAKVREIALVLIEQAGSGGRTMRAGEEGQ